ncbi:helix-turn-helix domain-containing protein [Devosia honganensis]|uniref:Helix-turn-helix domain-containing protein n=1 Tax=Devosia honganensis TaxID=1610527 RepID=A0ABV7WXG5_9HYPH
MTLIKTFDQNIRKLRKERGWTQEQLAFGAGIKRAYLSEIENGQRPANREAIIPSEWTLLEGRHRHPFSATQSPPAFRWKC